MTVILPSPPKRQKVIGTAPQNAFTQFIKEAKDCKKVVILDGATGSEIGKRAPESLSEDSWTGAAHLKMPQVIEDIHEEYVMCGASVVTTNTYAANKHCLSVDGMGERVVEANHIACSIAKKAIKSGGGQRSCFVCGSMSTHPPNFKAAVAAAAEATTAGKQDASKGVTDVNATGLSTWPSEEDELGSFVGQASALLDGGVDAIALEMVKDVYHASLVLQAAQKTGLPVCLGITIKLGEDQQPYLRDDPVTGPVLLVDAVKQYLEICPNVFCINIMHSPAEFISAGLQAVRSVWDGAMGCYPNNGTPESWPEWTHGDLGPQDLVKFAAGWAAEGATLIGGCCGIGPDHIRALAQHFGSKDLTWKSEF